jgi:hypothetical protein
MRESVIGNVDGTWLHHQEWEFKPAPQRWWYEPTSQKEDNRHLVNHFGDAFKYYLTGPFESRGEGYWPMFEKPAAYLQFCRLSRFAEFGWDNTRVIKETLKFIEKYGKPWFLTHKSPFRPSFETPLTVDEILFESETFASVVNVYKLLLDFNIDSTVPDKLRKYLKTLQRNKQTDLDSSKDWVINHLSNDKDVASAAEIYIQLIVNGYLEWSGIGLHLKIRPFAQRYTFRTLLDAMWLQFYLEILNQGKLRECANNKCRSLFVVSRSDKEFCSIDCRVKQYMRDNYRHKNKKEATDEGIHNKEE